MVAFTAQCPFLRVLYVGGYVELMDIEGEELPLGEYEHKRFQDLAGYLDSGALLHLRQLEVDLSLSSDEEMATFILSMRC